MGQAPSSLNKLDLEDYEFCTFFNKKEILHVHSVFKKMMPEQSDDKDFAIPLDTMLTLTEIQHNPFRRRMCEVFSRDGKGNLRFEDFLDMMSVFSEQATRDVKASYAFRIYDFDNDGYIGKSDLVRTLKALCGDSELKESEVEEVAQKILVEADLDGDQRLSYVEFDNVVARSPDFVSSFRVRI
mmetsp:Transcript_7865/g.20211  ORF Transcript_7865/g.20211 Transcript_7865/m.20211 type:complete len:184 (+) Transcript_7865:107-658(+)